MGFARSLVAPEQRDNPPMMSLQSGDPALAYLFGAQPSVAGPSIAPWNALRIGIVFACVTLKANAVRSIPLEVGRRDGQTGYLDLKRGANSRLAKLLANPNPEMAGSEMWSIASGLLDLWGNCYLLKTKGVNGLVEELWPIDPRRVRVGRINGRKVYAVSAGNVFDAMSAVAGDDEDILHIRAFSTNGLLGLSAIGMAREHFSQAAGQTEYLSRWMANGAHIPGFLSTDAELKDEDAKRLSSRWRAAHSGLQNVAKTPVLSNGLQWQKTGMSMVDAQFLELTQASKADICGMLQVPPSLVNAPSNGQSITYKNVQGESARFLRYGVQSNLNPIQEAIANDPELAFERGVVPQFQGEEAFMRMDLITLYEALRVAIASGLITQNEGRQKLGMQPSDDPEADKLIPPGTVATTPVLPPPRES